jgi:hypothetical protein
MNLYRSARSVIRASVCVAASLAASVCFGANAGRQEAQAQLLDHAEILCANCFFGPSNYYYCFAAENTVLIGYQRTPVLNWQDNSKNYLTSAHRAWGAWAAPGQTVPISYDDQHIWVTRADDKKVAHGLWGQVKLLEAWAAHAHSKQVRLTRTSTRDIFINNSRCRGADGAKTR